MFLIEILDDGELTKAHPINVSKASAYKLVNRTPDKRGNEDNSKITFLISQGKRMFDPSSEPSQF